MQETKKPADSGKAKEDESLWKPGDSLNRKPARSRSARAEQDNRRRRIPSGAPAKNKKSGSSAGSSRRGGGKRRALPVVDKKPPKNDRKPSGPAPGAKKSPSEEKPAPLPEDSWDISKFDVPKKEGAMRFHELGIPDPVMHAIADLGFKYCTPIQAEILPHILKGIDASGRAQTGTGKTAAFLICMLDRFIKHSAGPDRLIGEPRALILAPTRELALQIEKEAVALTRYFPLQVVSLIGGIDFQRQIDKLKKPVDIVVATPGRLLDFSRRRHINLGKLEILVIDEADRMLDMGFIPDVRSIIRQTPPKAKRQTLLFSATLTDEVTRLAAQWTRDPVTVAINPEQVTLDSIKQLVYITTANEKFALLYNLIKKAKEPVMVFGNRRDVTGGLMDRLKRSGVNCALLSGAVAQNKRLSTLDDFRNGKIDVLVATDVAGRGIHVDNVGFVINYNLPEDPEDYVHRIGRTGRAGALGTSISFACEEESFILPDIEKYIGKKLTCSYPEEELLMPPDKPLAPPSEKKKQNSRSGDRRNSGRRPSGRRQTGRR